MGGFFGVVSKGECADDLFYGTDYHSHLGNLRGGMMTWGRKGLRRVIHDITGEPFRAKFDGDLRNLRGNNLGIGCISDTGDQPILNHSHLGSIGAVMVGAINNLAQLAEDACRNNNFHFSEFYEDGMNPNEVAAALISSGDTIEDGIRNMQDSIDGSCSMLVLTKDGIYAIRDALGRTPVLIGSKPGSYCISMEPCAMFNVDFTQEYELGPGEAVLVTPDGYRQVVPPREEMKICSFLWVYYSFPASSFEGRNVEQVRYECGKRLARQDRGSGLLEKLDSVSGIPDSGVGHAIGYSHESGIPYTRPFMKYTPTWARSFIPQDQASRAHVATMKLIPIRELSHDKRLLFCEDSIVRGTQLGNTLKRLSRCGASEVHVRSACPPILFNCRYLNFSRSKGLAGLAAYRAIARLEGIELTGEVAVDDAKLAKIPLDEYIDHTTEKYAKMVDGIRQELGLTSVRFQTLPDLIDAIGLPREKLCTYCWDGKNVSACKCCKHPCH
ncbi:MAG: amidophosphoribosyltransferase [Victivallales bacterium]|nr:amidophosphoribosyltransferase [Victivallales bacterium]